MQQYRGANATPLYPHGLEEYSSVRFVIIFDELQGIEE